MKSSVTVCLAVRNSERHIGDCVRSLVAQTIRDFEIVVVEDPPYDRTKEILDSFKDKRILYSRNPRTFGIYKTRNMCVKQAKGNYLFFTDDDCVVSSDWIEKGLKSLSTTDCIGVEGKTYYVSEEYQPTFSDDVIQNNRGGMFMTCNMAYKRTVVESTKGFDEHYSRVGDRDLALSAAEFGKILFNPQMIVYHQKSIRTPHEFIRKSKAIVRNQVLLHRRFPSRGLRALREINVSKRARGRLWKIFLPMDLMILICPPLIIGSFFLHKYRTKEDFALFPYIYPMVFSERLTLWNECAKQRVFLI